jgi:transposase
VHGRDDELPVRPGNLDDAGASIVPAAYARAAIRKRASVARIVEHLQDARMVRRRPQEITLVRPCPQSAREQQTLLPEETARTVELFHNGKRIATHLRSSSDRKHTTVREHMPSSHQRYADWTPERLKRQAVEIGRNTATLVELILTEKSHPEQGFRAGVLGAGQRTETRSTFVPSGILTSS